jgi:pimeloyl-ACP methyl ester carboxylesterase
MATLSLSTGVQGSYYRSEETVMRNETKLGELRLHLAKNEILDYQYLRALSYQAYGGAATGEILYIAQTYERSGASRAAWVNTWSAQGRLMRRLADQASKDGHLVSARSFYLRAYNYLRAAEFYFDRKKYGGEAHRDLYREGVACFDAAIALFELPIEKIAISYLPGVFIPGYFFKPKRDHGRLPTIIVCGGGDSFGEETYFTAGVPEALERGFNVVVFHGPGQRGLLVEHPDQIFRTDYEVPIGCLIDYLHTREDVDEARLGLYGYSFGGYLTSRAAAFDQRIKALAANALLPRPQYLVKEALLTRLPSFARPVGERALIPTINLAMRTSWVLAATVEQSMWWTSGTDSVESYLRRLGDFTLEGLAGQIKCPVLCTIGVGEGQASIDESRAFFDLLPNPNKVYFKLTTEMGADNHVGLNNITYTAGVIFDWFSDVFQAGKIRRGVDPH